MGHPAELTAGKEEVQRVPIGVFFVTSCPGPAARFHHICAWVFSPRNAIALVVQGAEIGLGVDVPLFGGLAIPFLAQAVEVSTVNMSYRSTRAGQRRDVPEPWPSRRRFRRNPLLGTLS